jgi:hypothetical protein
MNELSNVLIIKPAPRVTFGPLSNSSQIEKKVEEEDDASFSESGFSGSSSSSGNSSDEKGELDDHVEATCSEALTKLEKLALESMEIGLEQYNAGISMQQERAVLAARAAYLKQKMEKELKPRLKKLEPQTFGWTERPWLVEDAEHAGETRWVGRSQSKITPQNMDSMYREGHTTYSILEHIEAQEFPLENENVSNLVFNGLLKSMVVDDMNSLTNQWALRRPDLYAVKLKRFQIFLTKVHICFMILES